MAMDTTPSQAHSSQAAGGAAAGLLDRWGAIAALLWLGFVGIATFQLIPLLTDQLADVYGFTDAQSGLVSAYYCGAGFIASVIAFWWLPRWDRRVVLFVVLAIGLVGEASSLFTHAYAALAAGRFVTGFAAASITCLVLSAITRSRRAEHLYGLYTATISLCAAAALIGLSYGLPAMRDALGDGALFVFFCCVWVAGIVAAFFVPRGTTSESSLDGAAAVGEATAAPEADAGLGAEVVRGESRKGLRIFSAGVLVLMCSPVVFYIANGGSWAFIGRVGTWTGLSDGQVGIALALSNVCAIIGGLIASWQGLRFKVVGPLVIGILLTMSANFIMLGRWGMAGYSVANFIGFGFTVYSVAMYLQAFGYVDPSGRLMASGGLALYGGGALGPVIMAQFIPAGDNPSYAAVLVADAVVFLLAPVVFIAGWAMVKRALARGEAQSPQRPPAETEPGVV
jgi:predicted MFS family arabinose efflux permease